MLVPGITTTAETAREGEELKYKPRCRSIPAQSVPVSKKHNKTKPPKNCWPETNIARTPETSLPGNGS